MPPPTMTQEQRLARLAVLLEKIRPDMPPEVAEAATGMLAEPHGHAIEQQHARVLAWLRARAAERQDAARGHRAEHR